MSRPFGIEVSDFSFNRLWDSVVVASVAERLNARTEFANYLKIKGHASIAAEEIAEMSIGVVIEKVLKVCDEWEALGIPRPLHITDQSGTIITWKHPKYLTISGRQPLPEHFCEVWQWVKNCQERAFLFCCAAYLFELGCSRIFVTDTRGDGGLDLIGIHEQPPLRGVCFLMQAKTAAGKIAKESLFGEYTKFLLLRHHKKWDEYQKALGIDKAADGVGLVYIFTSNQEFDPAVIQAARDLPIMLRSGKQIAHCLSKRADLKRWIAVRDLVGETQASLTRNLHSVIGKWL